MDTIESVVQAFDRMASKRAKGKILIQVAPAPHDPPTVVESAAI
jgi:hypothetical protein